MFEDYDQDVEDIKKVEPKYDEKGRRIPQRGEQGMCLARGTGMIRLKPFMFGRLEADNRTLVTIIRFENMVTGDVKISESTKDGFHKEDCYWLDEPLRAELSKCMDEVVGNKNKARHLMASKPKKVFTVRVLSGEPGERVPQRGEHLMWLTKGHGFLEMRHIYFAKISGQKAVIFVHKDDSPIDFTLTQNFSDGSWTEFAGENILLSEVYWFDELVMKEITTYTKGVVDNKTRARNLIVEKAIKMFPETEAKVDALFEDDEEDVLAPVQ